MSKKTETTHSSIQPSRYHRNLFLSCLLMLLILPGILYGTGRYWSNQTNEVYRDGQDGMPYAKRAQAIFQFLSYVPFWSHWSNWNKSALLYQVSNGMWVLELTKVPDPKLKQKAISFLIKNMKDATVSWHQQNAEEYLYFAGYHRELIALHQSLGWSKNRDTTLRAYLMSGQFEQVLKGLSKHPKSKMDQFTETDWSNADRLQCILGKYTGPVAKLSVLSQKKVRPPVKALSTSRKRYALEQFVVLTECAIRAKAFKVARRALPHLRAFSHEGTLMAQYFEARMLADAKKWHQAALTIQNKLFIPSGMYPHTPIVAQFKLWVLCKSGRWDDVIAFANNTGLSGRWRWGKNGLNPTKFGVLFRSFLPYSLPFWNQIASMALTTSNGKTVSKKRQDLAQHATFASAVNMGFRNLPGYREQFRKLKNATLAKAFVKVFGTIWNARSWTPNTLKLVNETKNYTPEMSLRSKHLLFRHHNAIRGWEAVARRHPPAQLQQMLQIIPLKRSIPLHSLLLNLSQRSKYGKRYKLSRLPIWKRNLEKWQSILSKQPNLLLIHHLKI